MGRERESEKRKGEGEIQSEKMEKGRVKIGV